MKRALSLSGGGAKCAYQAGALKYLMGELRREYEVITGVSGGALNAGRISQFRLGEGEKAAQQLIDDWSYVKQKEVYKSWVPFGQLQALCSPSLYNSKPLHKYVRSKIKLGLARASGRRVIVGAVCLDSGKYVLFDEQDDRFVDAILASSSYPLAFLPIEIDGRNYSDGGLRNASPVEAAIRAGANVIDVIITAPRREDFQVLKSNTMVGVALRSLEIMSDEIFQTDIAQAILINELIACGRKRGKKQVEINVLRPETSLTNDSLDFSQKNIQGMLLRGWEDAKQGGMIKIWP